MSLKHYWGALLVGLGLVLVTTPSSATISNYTIYQIQDTTSVGHFPVGNAVDTVIVSGILTGADTRPTGFGFYIQDAAGGDYSGVLVFTGGANSFSDSGYARGDIIEATGRVTEFSGETEIISRTGNAFGAPPVMVKTGSTAVPAPIVISNYGDIAAFAAYQIAERYEGVFVRVNGAKTARGSNFGQTNQWLMVDNAVVNPLDSVRVDGQTLAFPSVTAPAVGVVAPSVQGIGNQRLITVLSPNPIYGIQLRDGADIVVPSPPVVLNQYAISPTQIRILFDRALDPTTSQDVTKYSRLTLKSISLATLTTIGGVAQAVDLTCGGGADAMVAGEAEQVTVSGVKSALLVPMAGPATDSFRAGITPISMVQTNAPSRGDTSQFIGQQVTIRAITHARDLNLNYVQDSASPYSGLVVFAPVNNTEEGEDNTMSGIVTEFGSVAPNTEFSGLDYQYQNGTGASLYAPLVLSPGTVGARNGSAPFSGEPYEDMFIRVTNVNVVEDSLPNGQYLVDGTPSLPICSGPSSDTLRVDDNMYHHLFKCGTKLNITGICNDGFGQYTLMPRHSTDVDSIGPAVAVEPGAPALDFAVRSVTPTPVSFAHGGAVVRFTLPSAGRVSARIYNAAGQLIARPLNNVWLPAGTQSLDLDARSFGAARPTSGIFFIQFELANKVATGRMVVTE